MSADEARVRDAVANQSDQVGEAVDEKRQGADGEQQVKDRLRRIEGQVRGIHRMVDEHRPCVDVVTQLLAVRAALDRVAEQIITTHVDDCLATLPPEQAKTAIGKAIRMLARIEP